MNAAGKLGLVPLFGVESNRNGDMESRLNVIYYNFVKEFLEEVYDPAGLDRNAEHTQLYPDAFLRLPEASELLAEFEGGRASLQCLGACIDCLDGVLTYALMAKFDSLEFLERVRERAKPNNEIQSVRPRGPRIEFVTLNSPTLTNPSLANDMTPTSIFALDLVRSFLQT